jgi:hypothetical protein
VHSAYCAHAPKIFENLIEFTFRPDRQARLGYLSPAAFTQQLRGHRSSGIRCLVDSSTQPLDEAFSITIDFKRAGYTNFKMRGLTVNAILMTCLPIKCAVEPTEPEKKTLQGVVNLSHGSWKDGREAYASESVGRILGDVGEFAPCNEPCRELFAIA